MRFIAEPLIHVVSDEEEGVKGAYEPAEAMTSSETREAYSVKSSRIGTSPVSVIFAMITSRSL